MTLSKQDKEEMISLINQGITEVVLPVLENVATKDDLKELATKNDIEDIQSQLDTIERKLDAQQNRSDRHSIEIQNLQAAIA